MIHKLLGKSRKLAKEKKYPRLILLGHERGGMASAFNGSFVLKKMLKIAYKKLLTKDH